MKTLPIAALACDPQGEPLDVECDQAAIRESYEIVFAGESSLELIETNLSTIKEPQSRELPLNEFRLVAGNEQHPFIKGSGDRCSALHGLGQASSVWTGNKFIGKSHSVAIDLKEMKAANLRGGGKDAVTKPPRERLWRSNREG